MAALDIYIRDMLWKYIILLLILSCLLYVFAGRKFKEVRERFLVKQMKRFSQEYDRKIEGLKDELFVELDEIESGVIDLKNRGLIRILEIGVGAGTNLKYYPQQCRLIVADPNTYFKQHFIENKSKFPDIFLEKYLETRAENLGRVEDESVDVLVTTVVLCSVSNVQTVLREIRRVLVRGGRFYYLEHIGDHRGTRKYRIQRFLSTTTRIWPNVCGCWLDRRIDEEVLGAGFSRVEQKRVRLESNGSKLFSLIEPHVVGVAFK